MGSSNSKDALLEQMVSAAAAGNYAKILSLLKKLPSIPISVLEIYVRPGSELFDPDDYVVKSMVRKLDSDLNTRNQDGSTMLDRTIIEMEKNGFDDFWISKRALCLARCGAITQYKQYTRPWSGASSAHATSDEVIPPSQNTRSQAKDKLFELVRRSKVSGPIFVKFSNPTWRADAEVGIVAKSSSGQWQLQLPQWVSEGKWEDVAYNPRTNPDLWTRNPISSNAEFWDRARAETAFLDLLEQYGFGRY